MCIWYGYDYEYNDDDYDVDIEYTKEEYVHVKRKLYKSNYDKSYYSVKDYELEELFL